MFYNEFSLSGLSPRRPRFDANQSTWDLWLTKCYWDKFFSAYFGFPLSVSFHRKFIILFHSSAIDVNIILATGVIVQWNRDIPRYCATVHRNLLRHTEGGATCKYCTVWSSCSQTFMETKLRWAGISWFDGIYFSLQGWKFPRIPRISHCFWICHLQLIIDW